MKPKVGDKVKVIDNTHFHEFNIGEEVVILELDDDSCYKCINESDDIWNLWDEEIILIPSKERQILQMILDQYNDNPKAMEGMFGQVVINEIKELFK